MSDTQDFHVAPKDEVDALLRKARDLAERINQQDGFTQAEKKELLEHINRQAQEQLGMDDTH